MFFDRSQGRADSQDVIYWTGSTTELLEAPATLTTTVWFPALSAPGTPCRLLYSECYSSAWASSTDWGVPISAWLVTQLCP